MREIDHYSINPQVFQDVVNKLSTLPYNQVAELLNRLINTSKAQFAPAPRPMEGPGGKVVDNPPDGGDSQTDSEEL